jgi:hypothetical protein
MMNNVANLNQQQTTGASPEPNHMACNEAFAILACPHDNPPARDTVHTINQTSFAEGEHDCNKTNVCVEKNSAILPLGEERNTCQNGPLMQLCPNLGKENEMQSIVEMIKENYSANCKAIVESGRKEHSSQVILELTKGISASLSEQQYPQNANNVLVPVSCSPGDDVESESETIRIDDSEAEC